MKFKGNGAVWDGTTSKILCHFDKGELETNDETIINKLINLGYVGEGPIVDVTEVDVTAGSIEQPKTTIVGEGEKLIAPTEVVPLLDEKALRSKAQTLKVKNWYNLKPDNLRIAVEEAEKGGKNE